MSRVSLQDSVYPKPQKEGIAEEYPRQLAPSMGTLLAQDPASAASAMSSATSSMLPASSPAPSSPSLGNSIRFGSFEFTPHGDSSCPAFSDLQGGLGMMFGSVHYNINTEGILRLPEPFVSRSARTPSSPATGSTMSSSINLSARLTASTNSSPSSTPRSISSMLVRSDDSMSSDMTSYYCLNCDTRHGLGSYDTPFVCSAKYSSGEESIDNAARTTTWRMAHHQIYDVLNAGNGGEEEGERTPRASRRCNAGNSANNDDSVYTIPEEEWEAARAGITNNTRLPFGTSATYKSPVGIEELRHCRQKPRESMRTYIGRFTKLLNAAEDVSVNRAIDAFSDGIRRESYIEELGRKKPKTITKLMEIANSWTDGEDHLRKPCPRSDDEDDDQPRHDSGNRRDHCKKRKDRGYDDTNMVAAGYSDRRDDRKEEIEFEVVNWESQYHAILGRPAYAKFMAVPHYAYLKLKMPDNNGTNITVHGSFSRSDNCDCEFQRIPAKFGIKQEVVDLPSKQLTLRDKEEESVKKLKKKPEDPAMGVSAIGLSTVDNKASAEDSNALAIAASTSDEIIGTFRATGSLDKTQDKKDPPLA
ncbi:hypothetical protein QYE76_016411 [Lolium multiflorum]|uniref:Retrotransposon gag domain-containing protein n=1 Tax=Lolium multiflorum TaxID=4521 RepID=A0AAD8VDX9_LOLMU|nr:hypothetical protein QYE76_016411 [Lolium multiflorum]